MFAEGGMVTIKVRTLERGINITMRTLVREAVEKELENLGIPIPTPSLPFPYISACQDYSNKNCLI